MCAERKDIKFPAVGEEIQGTVEGVQNYGVFVKISDDIKAMLHGSEMATKDGREPDIRATFSVGDAVKVRSPCCMVDLLRPSICRALSLRSHMGVQVPLLTGLPSGRAAAARPAGHCHLFCSSAVLLSDILASRLWRRAHQMGWHLARSVAVGARTHRRRPRIFWAGPLKEALPAAQVRVLKVDAKNRRVDVTQRSEEEIEADRTLNEKGASTARTSGMNTLQAALARAGIRKQDFEDLSKVCASLGACP